MAPPPSHRIVYLQPEAPAYPGTGQACNGCGLCCLAEPCPLGQLLSRRRHGACVALRWQVGDAAGPDAAAVNPSRYVCAMVVDPLDHLAPAARPWRQRHPRLVGWLNRRLARLARRWIAAGTACDAAFEALPVAAEPHQTTQAAHAAPVSTPPPAAAASDETPAKG